MAIQCAARASLVAAGREPAKQSLAILPRADLDHEVSNCTGATVLARPEQPFIVLSRARLYHHRNLRHYCRMTNEVGKSEEAHEGRCLCGAIQFRTVGVPVKITVCHCPMCQRASGSAFTVELLFLRTAVSFEGTPPSTYTYRSPDHGRLLHYTFCSTCGTRLGVTLERFPALQIIYAGTYNNSSWVKPDSHIFTRSAAAWLHLPDDVDCFSAHMIDDQGNPQQPALRKV
jgi:hypothetical protein